MRKNPHVRICGGLGSATTLVYPTDDFRGKPVSAIAGHAVTLPAGGQVDCEHDSPAYRGRSAARWVPVGDGLTHKLTDLRSWLLNCRSSPAGESYGSQLTGWAVTQ